MTVDETIDPIDLRFSKSELETHRTHIIGFIQEQIDVAGVEQAVLGLSGGIDNTLTAYLTVEALGADGLYGLVMPGKGSQEENMTDAEHIAQDLAIEYDVIEIDPIVETVLDTYSSGEDDKTAVGNVQARVRAVLNYFVANHEGALVIGVGNRTEAAVGYFTKYGDGAVDCHPIGNLYKQQVQQLARDVGVPEDIVTKTPTAGLWAEQTDEKELGLDYDMLDAILVLHIDGPLSTAATSRLIETPEEEIERVHDLYEQSAHKRAMPPTPTPLP